MTSAKAKKEQHHIDDIDISEYIDNEALGKFHRRKVDNDIDDFLKNAEILSKKIVEVKEDYTQLFRNLENKIETNRSNQTSSSITSMSEMHKEILDQFTQIRQDISCQFNLIRREKELEFIEIRKDINSNHVKVLGLIDKKYYTAVVVLIICLTIVIGFLAKLNSIIPF